MDDNGEDGGGRMMGKRRDDEGRCEIEGRGEDGKERYRRED